MNAVQVQGSGISVANPQPSRPTQSPGEDASNSLYEPERTQTASVWSSRAPIPGSIPWALLPVHKALAFLASLNPHWILTLVTSRASSGPEMGTVLSR